MSRRIQGKHIQNVRAKGGKTSKRPRPKDESAYRGCKIAMKRFFKNPSKKTYAEFQRANNRLGIVNPTMALALIKLFKKEMYDRVLREEDFK